MRQMSNAVSDYLKNGRILSDEPSYLCTTCGSTVKNYDLSEIMGRKIYGHVTCFCVMRTVIERKGYAEDKRQQAKTEPRQEQQRRYVETGFNMRDMPF
ncbi:MAG: hypothetical protein PHT33_10770 [bacterium]|nr:hypothetical protein [bacterium]